MKKVVLKLTVFFAFALYGCDDNNETSVLIDYRCETSYQIDNKSDETITLIRVYGRLTNGDSLSETLSVASGEKKEIYSEREICGENTIVEEFRGKTLPILLNNISIDVYAGNQLINDDLLNKENWSFAAEEYYRATYLLVLTDELIESVGLYEVP